VTAARGTPAPPPAGGGGAAAGPARAGGVVWGGQGGGLPRHVRVVLVKVASTAVVANMLGCTYDQVVNAVSGAIDRTRPDMAGADPVVRRSDWADFQANAALALAKRAKINPRDLAAELTTALGDQIGTVEPSGPGFLNITVPDRMVWDQVAARLADDRLGVGSPEQGRRTVIDYSAPNIAKEMHVGHMRTTIIGDSLARVLGFLGSEVIRQNHLGDWGTQFGMLIQYLDEHPVVAWHQD
jgi:arginyl-tRNA synthetase